MERKMVQAIDSSFYCVSWGDTGGLSRTLVWSLVFKGTLAAYRELDHREQRWKYRPVIKAWMMAWIRKMVAMEVGKEVNVRCILKVNWEFPGGPVASGVRVQSLVGELRSRMLHGTAKKKKKKKVNQRGEWSKTSRITKISGLST